MAKGQQVLLGELHVRDFVDEGQPLPILLAAGIQVAGGHSMFGETVFDASLIALGIAVAFVVLRLSQAPVLLTWILPVAAVVLQPRLYNYPKLFLYPVALLFCFALLRRPSRRRVLAFGLFIGVAFLFRHDHGAYIGTVGLLATVLATVRQSRAVVLTRALQLAGCIAIPMLPYLAFVATYGNLVEYFQDGLHFARAEADRTGLNRLPRFAVDASRGPLEFAELPPTPLARVNVRWTDAVDDARRPRVERQLGLANPRHLGDTVYQYESSE